MKRLTSICATVSLAWLASGAAWAQGDLEEVREAARTPDPPQATVPSNSRDNRFYDDPWADDPIDDAVGWVALAAIATPYYIPHAALDEPGYDRFAGYCEEHGSGWKDAEWFYRSNDLLASARAQVEYGTNFGDLQSVGTRMMVDLPVLRTSLDASWTSYHEDLPAGGTDQLALGDANLVWRFVQNPRTHWRSGIGINWLTGGEDDLGFNFTYGFDVLPIHPVVWSNELDLGTLGHATLLRLRTTIGAQWREGELYTGFEYVDIDHAHLPTLLVGFRYWW